MGVALLDFPFCSCLSLLFLYRSFEPQSFLLLLQSIPLLSPSRCRVNIAPFLFLMSSSASTLGVGVSYRDLGTFPECFVGEVGLIPCQWTRGVSSKEELLLCIPESGVEHILKCYHIVSTNVFYLVEIMIHLL